MKRSILAVTAITIAAASPAQAQLGGLGVKVPGLSKGDSSSSAVSGDEVDQFLAKTVNATKHLAIAMIILNEAAAGHEKLGAQQEVVTSLSKSTSVKEINSRKEELTSAADALSSNQNLVEQVSASYKAANAKQKAMITTAVYNFALFLPELPQMPKNVSTLLSGIGSNPRMLGKLNELKTAGSLIGLQLKGTVTVLKVLPGLMSVAQVKAPTKAQTSTAREVTF